VSDCSLLENNEVWNKPHVKHTFSFKVSWKWTKNGSVRFEVFPAVTMKNGVYWDVMPCGSCKNRCFGGTQRLLHQGDKNRWTRNNVSCN
jgi:hypothetical protein